MSIREEQFTYRPSGVFREMQVLLLRRCTNDLWSITKQDLEGSEAGEQANCGRRRREIGRKKHKIK